MKSIKDIRPILVHSMPEQSVLCEEKLVEVMTSSHRNARNVGMRGAKFCKTIHSNYKITSW